MSIIATHDNGWGTIDLSDLHFQGVYLLCFATPFWHARHYLGYAEDIAIRVSDHLHGRGSHLTRAVYEARITMYLVRYWSGGTRSFERYLKDRKHTSRFCPRCIQLNQVEKLFGASGEFAIDTELLRDVPELRLFSPANR